MDCAVVTCLLSCRCACRIRIEKATRCTAGHSRWIVIYWDMVLAHQPTKQSRTRRGRPGVHPTAGNDDDPAGNQNSLESISSRESEARRDVHGNGRNLQLRAIPVS